MEQFLRLPTPFKEVDYGRGKRPTDTVPGVLFLLELLVGLAPCLLQGLDLVLWPGLDEVVDGFDVLDEDLITGINVAFGMDVIRHIKEPSGVMSQMFCHSIA